MENRNTVVQDTRVARIKEVSLTLLSHVEGQVVFGDTKGALLVAADAILISAYLSAIKDFNLLKTLFGLPLAIFLLSFLLLVIAFILALWSVAPNPKLSSIEGVLFFGRIARFKTQDEFIDRINSLSDQDIERELLAQIYGKSQWALRKFKLLRGATILTIASLILSLVVVMLKVSAIGSNS